MNKGDIIQIGDRCVMACGDITAGHGEQLLERFGPADICYTDPPWNEGIQKVFMRWAESQSSCRQVFESLNRLLKQVPGMVFIEIGQRSESSLEACLTRKIIKRFNITYKGGRRPCRLLVLTPLLESPDFNVPDCEGMDDSNTPLVCMKAARPSGGTVIDTCVGLGTIPLAAHAAGLRFIGLEVNPKRLAVAVKRIEKATSRKAQKIGELK